MNMMEARDNLTKNRGNKTTSEWTALAGLDKLEEMAFHGLEDKIELFRLWNKEGVVEGDNARVQGNGAQGLEEEMTKGEEGEKERGGPRAP
jgi:hypothetical protein